MNSRGDTAKRQRASKQRQKVRIVKQKYLTKPDLWDIMCRVIDMNDILERSLLYDFYGELLTDRQKKVYQAVVFDDLSPSEVAEEEGISRQGVHDMVRRCEKLLQGYEDKLGLVARFSQTKDLVAQIRQQAELFRKTGDASCVSRIEHISMEIGEL